MNTKHLFVLVSFAVACVCACIINLTNYNYEQVSLLKEAIGGAHKLNTDFLLLRKNEKNFLTRLNWAEIKKFEANVRLLEQDVAYLVTLLQDMPHLISSLDTIQNSLDSYRKSFQTACEFNVKIGFDYDHGLRGALKDTYYQSEDYIRSLQNHKDFPALSYTNKLLALSVHEKNFLLKSSNKYYDRFLIGVKKMMEDLDNETTLKPAMREELKGLIQEYLETFKILADMIIYQQRDIKSPLEELSRSAHEIEYTVYYVSHKIIDEILTIEKGTRNFSSIAMFSFSLGLFSLALTPFISLLFGRHTENKSIAIPGVDGSFFERSSTNTS